METIIDIAAISAAAKTLTDVILLASRFPKRYAPAIALAFAVLLSLLNFIAQHEPSMQGLALVALQSIISFASSVIATEMQKSASDY